MVGAWCFVDAFGPATGGSMHVPPHPHTGLQTVTWLLEGTIRHRDSLANTSLIAPGQLNLMTAGRGIAHAEVSPPDAPPGLHGVQLWVALPDEHRGIEPRFAHHPVLPTLADGGATVTVLVGSLGGVTSPARIHSPLVGAQVTTTAGASIELPLEPEFEHAVLPLGDGAEVDGVAVPTSTMIYLGRGRDRLTLGRAPSFAEGANKVPFLVLGGAPFEEKIVMWWNFIGRSHDEIVADREDWMAGRRFGPVQEYDGGPLPAPAMPTSTLLPRGRVR
jgi:quercetin 2,3-dioxygenase